MKEKLLKALDLDKKGDWDGAHQIVQNLNHNWANWIHAYLHRKEPDLSNAAYWYRRAGRKIPEYSLEKEWKEIYDYIKTTEIKE